MQKIERATIVIFIIFDVLFTALSLASLITTPIQHTQSTNVVSIYILMAYFFRQHFFNAIYGIDVGHAFGVVHKNIVNQHAVREAKDVIDVKDSKIKCLKFVSIISLSGMVFDIIILNILLIYDVFPERIAPCDSSTLYSQNSPQLGQLPPGNHGQWNWLLSLIPITYLIYLGGVWLSVFQDRPLKYNNTVAQITYGILSISLTIGFSLTLAKVPICNSSSFALLVVFILFTACLKSDFILTFEHSSRRIMSVVFIIFLGISCLALMVANLLNVLITNYDSPEFRYVIIGLVSTFEIVFCVFACRCHSMNSNDRLSLIDQLT